MSELNNQNRHNYSKYDEMSTEALEQILRLDFGSLDETESDIDAILYISEVIEKRKRQSNEIDVDTAWEKFKTKYHPYTDGRSLYDFGDEDSNQTSEEGISKISLHNGRNLLRFRRLMIVAALLVACLFGGIMVAQASGIDVLGVVGRWTDETFHFITAGSRELSTHKVDSEFYETVELTLDEWGIDKDLFPTWHPEGFVAQEPRVANLNDSDTISVSFKEKDRSYSVRISCFYVPTAETGSFEKDDVLIEEYLHNGDIFYIFTNIDTITATCYDGECMTTIGGSLTVDELKHIIDSIGGN